MKERRNLRAKSRYRPSVQVRHRGWTVWQCKG